MFVKGQSGNPNGRNKNDKIFRDALLVALKRTDGDATKIARLANAIVDKACEGDVPAAREVMDRVDGKVVQALSGDGEGNPFVIQIVKFDANPQTPE
jgi:hypothetical protein